MCENSSFVVSCKCDVKSDTMQQVPKLLDKQENDIKNSPDPPVKIETLSERDAGFCSGEDTDIDTGYHSPTETSQDSIDAKNSVNHFIHGKRNLTEPKMEPDEEGPKFKKIKVESGIGSSYTDSIKSNPSPLSLVKEEVCSEPAKIPSPFRPWDLERPCSREWVQEEPLALVVDKRKMILEKTHFLYQSYQLPRCESADSSHSMIHDLHNSQRLHKVARTFEPEKCVDVSMVTPEPSGSRRTASFSPPISVMEDPPKSSHSNSHQRNYKNMTRERRIEANARERTRVHTISAAYDNLRKCVPSYANNQKLSKLSILRIACSYIMTLSRMAGEDYSEDQSEPSLESCIESVTNTIQMEGKTRKKKDG